MVDCETHAETGISSDHLTVRAKMRLATFIPKKQTEKESETPKMNDDEELIAAKEKITKVDWKGLRDETVKKGVE